MQVGNSEVERVTLLGGKDRRPPSILAGVDDTNSQARAIAQATAAMTGSVESVSTAAAEVGQLATRAAIAAGKMKEDAQHVNTAIENIAAVSENRQPAPRGQRLDSGTDGKRRGDGRPSGAALDKS